VAPLTCLLCHLLQLQMALDHRREELRVQKVETSAAQSKYKQLALQVEIQAERDATRRAEDRLRGMGDGSHHARERAYSGSTVSSVAHHPPREQPRASNNAGTTSQSRRQQENGPSHSHGRRDTARNSHYTQQSRASPERAPHHADVAEEAQVTTQQQLRLLQELARADLQHAAAQPHPSYPQHHDRHMPPPPPAEDLYDDHLLRTSLQRSEHNLDHDVVLQTMLSQDYSRSAMAAIGASSTALPPRWRQESADSAGYSGSVSSIGNSRSLLSARADRSAHRGVSMSDSELDPKDSRPRGREEVRNSADFEYRPRSSSSSAVSFIRQKVIDSSAGRAARVRGGNSSGLSSFATHHQYPDHGERRAGIAAQAEHSPGWDNARADAARSIGSPDRGTSSAAPAQRPMPGSESSGGSGGKQMSRLQALYERISSVPA
jgi:hypothetical protein